MCSAKNLGPGHYYDNDFNECRECTGGTRYTTIFTVLGTGILFAIGSGILMHYLSLPLLKACKPKRRVLRAVWGGLRSLMIKVSRSEHQTPYDEFGWSHA